MNKKDLDAIIDIVMERITTNVPSHSFGTQVDVELGIDDINELRSELKSFIKEHIF